MVARHRFSFCPVQHNFKFKAIFCAISIVCTRHLYYTVSQGANTCMSVEG